MLNRDEPVRAGLLTILLPVLGGFLRVLLDQRSAVGALVLTAVAGAALALIASHVGAGVQRRRTVTDTGR
jgi:hypothetical protein